MKVLIFIVISIGFVLTVDLPQPRDKIQGILENLITKAIKGTQQRILEDPDRLNIHENHEPMELITGKLDNRSDDSTGDSKSSEEGMRKDAKLTAGRDNRSDSESSEEGMRKNAKLTAGRDNRSDSESSDEGMRKDAKLTAETDNRSDSESSEEGTRKNAKLTAGKDNRSDSESSEEGMRKNAKLTAGKDNRSDSESSEEGMRKNAKLTAETDNRSDSESSEEGTRKNAKLTAGRDNRSDSESSEEGMRKNAKLTAGKDNRSDSESSEEGMRKDAKLTAETDNRSDSESSEEGTRKNAKLTAGKDNRSDSESSEEGMRKNAKLAAGKDNRSDSESSEEGMRKDAKLTAETDNRSDSESSEEGTRKNAKLTAGKDNRSDSESSEEGMRKNVKLAAGKDNRSDSESSEEGMRKDAKLTAGIDNRSDSESSEEGTRKNEVHHRISAKSDQFNIQENDFMPAGLKELIAAKLNDRSDDSISSEEAVKGIERIFGGQIAPRNAYPHQVAMSLMFVTGGSSWCGGSIISDSYILTAAHCLDNVFAATIMMGAYDRLNSAESGRVTQTVRSGNFIVHRGWQSSLMRNDIALIRLNNKIQFTNSIQAISLPTQFEIAEGKPAIISGWGHYDNSKQLSRYLRHAESRIIDLSYCKQYFNQYITESNICLDGSAGQGTCHGDSGGPLIIQSTTGKAVLMGLTSFGSGTGCNMRWPTVFTRVSSFLSWIQQNASI